MIKTNDDWTLTYYDKNGTELKAGDMLRYDNGLVHVLYNSDDGYLCTDATNPAWIKSGRACPCEYGLYPLAKEELEKAEKVGDDERMAVVSRNGIELYAKVNTGYENGFSIRTRGANIDEATVDAYNLLNRRTKWYYAEVYLVDANGDVIYSSGSVYNMSKFGLVYNEEWNCEIADLENGNAHVKINGDALDRLVAARSEW